MNEPSSQPAPARSQPSRPVCRLCGEALATTFVDLGMSPLCESFLPAERLNSVEAFYPLHAYVCDSCLLVQLEAYVSPESIFCDYAYFSSYSSSWLDHSRRYVDAMVNRLGLSSRSKVVEVASNDGYLLQYFLPHGIVPLGIEPAANVAREAAEKGVPTLVEFFSAALAGRLREEDGAADLIIGNNVLAQVPDLHDFVEGLRLLLAPAGVVTLEFPHIMRLMEHNQFDTIYHEHFSYFSLLTTSRLFAEHGLTVYDVDELGTHGGSLRIYARHAERDEPAVASAVTSLRKRELDSGLGELAGYLSFAPRVEATKRRLLSFLIDAKDRGRTVAGYGAPGKGNTLLNYCGIRTDLLDYTVDRNPHKQGMFLPGTHIPIYAPERLAETKPDYVLILPWNLKEEIVTQLEYVRSWGGRFVVPIPEVEVL